MGVVPLASFRVTMSGVAETISASSVRPSVLVKMRVCALRSGQEQTKRIAAMQGANFFMGEFAMPVDMHG